MNYLILIIIGAFGIWFGMFLAGRKNKNKVSALNQLNEAAREKKEAAKRKILEKFEEQEKMTNDNVQELLDISDSTATRYFEELEEEGKIVQRGETGRGIFYELKR